MKSFLAVLLLGLSTALNAQVGPGPKPPPIVQPCGCDLDDAAVGAPCNPLITCTAGICPVIVPGNVRCLSSVKKCGINITTGKYVCYCTGERFGILHAYDPSKY